jgi:membrane protein required for colicin V production
VEIFDIVVILILALGGYAGYKKGLLLEIVTFLAFIIAVLSAFKLLKEGMNWIQPYMEDFPQMLPYVTFTLIFLLVFIGIYFFGKFLKSILDYTLLGTFDSAAGAFVGVIKTAFIISLFIWLTSAAKLEFISTFGQKSFAYPVLASFAPNTIHFVSYIIPFQDIFPALKKILENQKA